MNRNYLVWFLFAVLFGLIAGICAASAGMGPR